MMASLPTIVLVALTVLFIRADESRGRKLAVVGLAGIFLLLRLAGVYIIVPLLMQLALCVALYFYLHLRGYPL